MCARFELGKTRFQPSNTVAFWRTLALAQQLIWAGFVRREWLRGTPSDGDLVDIPADRFAERSRRTAQLVWDEVPVGQVIRGLVLPNRGNPILRIVTRGGGTLWPWPDLCRGGTAIFRGADTDRGAEAPAPRRTFLRQSPPAL